MGIPSLQADIEDRANDSRFMADAIAGGSTGAAGVYRRPRPVRPQPQSPEAKAELEARALEQRTGRFVDDRLAWIEAAVGVVPLRK